MDDCIRRQAAIAIADSSDYIWLSVEDVKKVTDEVVKGLKKLPPVQPEYEPVKAEDFARTMSENTLYSFMAWHLEALELMERQGFVICKKTM